MEFPAHLQPVAQAAASGVPLAQLSRAAEILSGRYRQEVLDGAWHVSDDLAARAYVVTRLPATFGAVAAALQAVALARADFVPRSLLDVGAGPATATLAALETWDTLEDLLLLEGSPHMRAWGEKLLSQEARWQSLDVRQGLPPLEARDLVTLAYVLNEIELPAREKLVAELWARTADTLLIVESGTPAGWRRILEARAQLLALGAELLAPCPHAQACPVVSPDWCHFSQRVPRSRWHRQGKGAELGYEDEKFIYLAASRRAGAGYAGRVLTSPAGRSGLVALKLCTAEGTLEHRTLSKRDGAAFKVAKKLEWGDEFPFSAQ